MYRTLESMFVYSKLCDNFCASSGNLMDVDRQGRSFGIYGIFPSEFYSMPALFPEDKKIEHFFSSLQLSGIWNHIDVNTAFAS